LRDISLSFGKHPLLDKINLSLDRNERIALIGRNGMGKSTLLKIIQKKIQPDNGLVEYQDGLIVAELPQTWPSDASGTVYDCVAGGLGEIANILSEYMHNLSHQHLEKLADLQAKIDAQNGWVLSQRIDKILSFMSLKPDAEFARLSGGMQRRVLLARALVQEPDILILDEPTNHLDIESIEWLENFLLNYKKTVLFITHDRAFMQSLATRIIELDQGYLTNWLGSYRDFLTHKETELAAQASANALFDKRLAQEEAWIRQGIKARRTRNEGRVRALKKMREERRARRDTIGKLKLSDQDFSSSGQIVVALDKVNYQLNNNKFLIKNFTANILRGDKIAIIGSNGVGKSTLIKIVLGQLAPQSGEFRQGTRLQIGYFDQARAFLDEEKTVIENVCPGGQMITVNGQSKHAISYLQDFLFTPERSRSLVKVLSGGERNRLLLARLLAEPVNVLILDEPTNDLDVETLELLEEFLAAYQGTVLLVSHDREFINHVVTATWVFEGGGHIQEYAGDYDDYLLQRPVASLTSTNPKNGHKTVQETKPVADAVVDATAPKLSGLSKLSYKEKIELESLPARIEALEAEINALQESMSSSSFYQQPPDIIAKTRQLLEEKSENLKTAYERWESLESRN
jgi:ATP-binding cassette subfamily F protein uup